MTLQAIKGFSGPYRYLSNFWVEPDGSHVEGEFQAAKCAEAQDRKLFTGKTPAQCKAIGRKVLLTPDWEAIKVDVMLFYVTKKFKDHLSLQHQLHLTRTAYLEETNTWGDVYWGVCRGRGDNMLGHILMEVRLVVQGKS